MSLLRQLPFFLLAIVIVMTACSDDDPAQAIHHANPVWTPDGKTIVAGYDQFQSNGAGTDGPRTQVSRMAVMDFTTRQTRIIDLGDVMTWHTLYAFDPSGKALAFAQSGRIRFYGLDGQLLLEHQPATGGDPRFVVFNNTGNSFVWLGLTSTGYTVNLTTYDASSWDVLDTTPLSEVTTTEAPIALCLTSQRSYAVRMSSGLVREVDFNDTELNSYSIKALQADNPWHTRLIYYSNAGNRYLYTIDGDGLMRLDLVTGSADQLVRGEIVDLDVSDTRRSMVYETHTGDTWLSNQDGSPLSRIAPQNLMPRFSPANNGIALVQRIDAYRDSLHILLLR